MQLGGDELKSGADKRRSCHTWITAKITTKSTEHDSTSCYVAAASEGTGVEGEDLVSTTGVPVSAHYFFFLTSVTFNARFGRHHELDSSAKSEFLLKRCLVEGPAISQRSPWCIRSSF